MGENEPFDDDAGSLALQTGEFLAGVLALSRISRVTVALEPGEGAGAALLGAARLTGHAETCLLFDRWDGDALDALTAAVLQADADAHPDVDAHSQPTPDQPLPQVLQALQKQRRQSFLMIFDRFERYLALPPEDRGCMAFDQAFVDIAGDSGLDVHFLLVLDEGTEFMLERFQDRIPGISDGCLRIPFAEAAGNRVDRAALRQPSGETAPAAQRNGQSLPMRDRSFGRLLERLTAGKPTLANELRSESQADEPAAPEADGSLRDVPSAAQAELPATEPEAVAPDMPVAETPVSEIPAAETPLPEAPAPDMPVPETPAPAEASPATHPPMPEPLLDAVQPVQPGPRKFAMVTVLALIAALAVTAGITAYRQRPAPAALAQADAAATPTPAADSAATPAATPAATEAPAAPTPAPVVAEKVPEPAERGAALVASTAIAAPAEQAPAAAASLPQQAQAARPSSAANAGARTTPAVYIHVRNARELQRMQALARTLATRGIRVIEVKVVNKGPNVADFRYFRDEEKDEAAALQKTLLSLGLPVAKLSRMAGFENRVPRHQYEAWLADDAKARPSRR